MESQIEECLEAEQAIFIVIGQAKERERSNFWWTCWWLDLTTWWWWWWWWLWTEKHLEFHLNCLTRLDLWKKKTILNACCHLYCHLRERWIWLSKIIWQTNIIVFFWMTSNHQPVYVLILPWCRVKRTSKWSSLPTTWWLFPQNTKVFTLSVLLYPDVQCVCRRTNVLDQLLSVVLAQF